MDLQIYDDRDSPWDFKTVRHFLESYNSVLRARELLEDESIPDPEKYNPKSQATKGLGDFDRLFTFCGKPLLTPTLRSDDSSSARYEDSTPPSSAPDDESLHFDDFVNKAKEVRWTDQEGTANLAEFRRRSTRGSTNGDLDASEVTRHLIEDTDPSGLESDTEDEICWPSRTSIRSQHTRTTKTSTSHASNSHSSHTREHRSKQRQQSQQLPIGTASFLPASVTPSRYLLHRPPGLIDPNELSDPTLIIPIYTLTASEQKAKLAKKLAKVFVQEAQLLKNPETIIRCGGNLYHKGIHVFVDLSNIVIGFTETIKNNRVKAGKLRPNIQPRQPPFSFHSLALTLERGRPVRRRVMVGSTSNKLYKPDGNKLPDHVLEGQKLGYETNILERVAKPFTPHRVIPKKKGGTGSGYATSGHSSASETQISGRLKMQEQAVDELLQMKMLESIVDCEPSTLVLASGDAAEAEYSGGFLQTVERALIKGWKVEVLAWSKGLSHEYRSTALALKWRGKLSVYEIDDFCEEMLGLYPNRYVSHVYSFA